MSKFIKIALITSLIIALLGILFLIAGVSLGISFINNDILPADGEIENINKTFAESISRLEIDFKVGILEIEPGESLSIKAENIPKNSFKYSIENESLIIEADFPEPQRLRPGNFFSGIFKWGSFIFGRGENNNNPRAVITLPQSFLDSAKIKTAAADLSIKNLECKNLEIEIAAGRLKGANIYADNCEIKTAAGETSLKAVFLNNLKAVTETGSFSLSGGISGDSTVATRVGSCKLEIWNNLNEYNLSLNNSLGTIKINNKEIDPAKGIPRNFARRK